MAAKQRRHIPSHKIVLIGAYCKSQIVLQFVNDKFVEYTDPSIDDEYCKQVVLDNEDVEADIIDAAAEEEFVYAREQLIRCGEGFMCVFDITIPRTFKDVLKYREQILRVRKTSSDPFLLVGAKADSSDDKRRVTKEEAEALAAEWGVPYIEVSAKTGLNIRKVFFDLMRLIRDKRLETSGENDIIQLNQLQKE